jgi:hypothetical protein
MITTLAGCSLGQVGGPEPTSCELAAQHVNACLGDTTSITSITGTCDAQQAAQANQVLATSCYALAGQRSTSSLKDAFCNLVPFFCSKNNEDHDSRRMACATRRVPWGTMAPATTTSPATRGPTFVAGVSCFRTPDVIVDYEKPGVSWVRIWRCF